MTLKAILKKHGIKARGLESELCNHFRNVWEPDFITVWEEKKELAKLNIELHDRCKEYREQVAKLEDQVKAAEVKTNFLETKRKETNQLLLEAMDKQSLQREMIHHLRQRINSLDDSIVHTKTFKS